VLELSKITKSTVRDHAIIAGVVLVPTIAIMVFKPTEQPLNEVLLLLAGLSAGALFLRFGMPRPWMAHIVLLLFMVITVALGNYFIGWFGGFIAGSNLGVVWRVIATKKKVKYPWTVDGQGYNTITEVRKVASTALRSLDGNKHWRLTVEHSASRFDASGSAESGLVCHRSPDADKVGSWAILGRSEHPEDTSVDVPMGGLKGFVPSRFVSDLEAAESALKDFLKNPDSASLGPEWITDEIAEDLHLGS
jgi:hypothetical protein